MTRSTGSGITLRAGDLRLAVRPDLGGSLAGLWQRDTPVLRSTEPELLAGPRQSACFVLLPYSNRIGHRRFQWLGKNYTTPANFEGSPHSLHGVGWLRAWHVIEQGAAHLTLHYRHVPDSHWPFAFEAQQRITLTPEALQMEVELRNTDTQDQPAGLGWHPYFPKRESSHIQMAVAQRWEPDALLLPKHAIGCSRIDANVGTLALDHCFSGWNGVALIRDSHFVLRLSSSLTYAVVFTPPGQAHFCVEPVSHVNNAIGQADPTALGLVALTPGETLNASMTLELESVA